MSVGMATSAVSKIWEFVGPTILRQGGYILFCKIYAKDLKLQVKKLKDASARIRHSVDEAESVGDIIEDDVWTWLNKSDQLIESGNMILGENNIVSCCFHMVPDPKSCYTLGRKAKKFLPNLEAHSSEGKSDKVSYHLVAESVEEVKVRLATSSSTVRYVELKSRAIALKNIMAALDNDNTKVIGVCGMGGVGKTTLLKEVESRAKESGKFDDVVSAFVSQNPDTKGIRNKIVNRLGRLGSKEDEATKKPILILLDDLWTKLNLKDVGVPESNNKVRVKLVMTSRKQDLLANEMNCHPTFSLGVLDEEEGWRFFSELVSGKVENLKKNHAAVELLKKCAGLPVSVEALATVWKKKTKDSSSSSSDVFNVDELKHGKESPDGSLSLELSYNYLGDSYEEKQAKLLFRTIGLLGTPNVPIMTLLKYTVGLGLFGSSTNGNIMERARREVTRSLRTLQDSSLLLESDDSNHVKIHDVVRDVAVRIASRDDHALIFNPDNGVKDWSRQKLKKSTAVSLPYSATSELHMGWRCPNANIFIMKIGDEQGVHVELPNSFFNGMVKLKVVDLQNARLTSLPSSIQADLRYVTTLCLHYCYLENVAVIGKLESLQVLSLIGSEIAELPEELGELTNLRMLDLSKCSKLESIKPGVLERLTRLEELYLKESFNRWEIEGDGQNGNSGLAELNNLQRLSTLEVHVPDTNALPPKLSLGDLVQYKVLMGDAWDWSGELKEVRTLKFKVNSDNTLTEEWVQSTLQKTQDLHLDGLGGTWDSFHELCKEGFNELKHLHLQNSSSIKYIIWSTEWLACSAFTILESINLEIMESLEKICHGLINPTSFSKLKVVRVHKCDMLRNLFNLSLVKSLTELEEIKISDCKMVREIVIAEEVDDDGTREDRKVIDCSNNLFDCPIKISKLSKSCTKTSTDAKELDMDGADNVILLGNLRGATLVKNALMSDKLLNIKQRKFLEHYLLVVEKNRYINLHGLTWPSESMEINVPIFFDNQQVSQHSRKLLSPPRSKEVQTSALLGLGNLRQVELDECKNIVHFINSHMLLKLVNLESLTISRCESLEDIFELEGLNAKSGNSEILPKLYELKLRELPNLVHIWKKKYKQTIKGCQKLRTLEIHQCGNLPYLSSSSVCECMENLTEISIVRCGKMQTVFMEEEGPASKAPIMFQLVSLKILGISNCPNLKAFLSSNCRMTTSSGNSCLNINSSTAFKCNNTWMTYWCCCRQDLADASIIFFNQKVLLPSLETLILTEAGEFEKLWGSEVPDESYCNLEILVMKGCQNLLTVFPAPILERLQNLKQLQLSGCQKLESVFDLDVDWVTKKKPKSLMLPQLHEVRLNDLQNLKHIMQEGSDHKIVVSFQSLQCLEVMYCSKLTYLIPTATATTLLKLEKLYISDCLGLKKVIHGEVSDRNKKSVITFPHLTSLGLYSLESLTCFSSENYFFDFSRLKVLHIQECYALNSWVKPRSDGCKGSQDEDQANTTTKALFNDKVGLPNLEELKIGDIAVEELWCNESPMGSFCKLRFFYIQFCSRLQIIIPSFITKRLQNLEHMVIRSCNSIEDIFKITSSQQIQLHGSNLLERCLVEEGTEDDIHATDRIIQLTKLRSLDISGNIKLTNLWSGSYMLELPSLKELRAYETDGAVEAIIKKVNLPSLEKLEVINEEMAELWQYEPHHVGSFCKLKHLIVVGCGQLVKIIPSFMLKRLQNLEEMEVKKCRHLEIIFERQGGLLNDVLLESESNLAEGFSFLNLTSVHVENCERLRNLFSISGQHHNKYDGETTNSYKLIVLPQLTKLRLEGLPNFSHLLFQGQLQYTLELSSLKEFFLIASGAKEAVTDKAVFPVELQIHEKGVFLSTTSFLGDIMKALQIHQIIRVLGFFDWPLRERLKQRVKEEANLFDDVVFCYGSDKVQEGLGRELGIIYGEVGVQGRAQRLRKSLLTIHDKRLLLILFTDSDRATDLESLGIPRDGLDPKLFKIILVSENREELGKVGVQQVIDLGFEVERRWWMFAEKLEDLQVIFCQELPEGDTNTNVNSIPFIESTTNIVGDIMKFLQSHQNKTIGLLGSLGYRSRRYVPQQLFMKETNKLFHEIVRLDRPTIQQVQNVLISNLGIICKETDERAQHLRQSLLSNRDKRLLLLLNSLDEEIDLQAIGIPRDELDPKLFKIIVISKKREILEKMGAQQVIDIGSESTIAWCWRILDGYLDVSDLTKLADECGSADLALILANKLKGQGLRAWANALQRLKDCPFEYEVRKKVIDSL